MSTLGPQFTQPTLPGMRSPSPAPQGNNSSQGVVTSMPVYTSGRNMQGNFIDNPIHEPKGTPRRDRLVSAIQKPGALKQKPHEEWVPTYEVKSTQVDINDDAVNHIVRSNPDGNLPSIDAWAVNHDKGRDFWVRDGNHRTNAALRRGQMLLPAQVSDLKA